MKYAARANDGKDAEKTLGNNNLGSARCRAIVVPAKTLDQAEGRAANLLAADREVSGGAAPDPSGRSVTDDEPPTERRASGRHWR